MTDNAKSQLFIFSFASAKLKNHELKEFTAVPDNRIPLQLLCGQGESLAGARSRNNTKYADL